MEWIPVSFDMLDFEKFVSVFEGASYLWISDTTRAWAFFMAFIANISVLTAVELSNPWRVLSFFEASLSRSSSFQLATWKVARRSRTTGDIVLMVGGSATRELTAADSHVSRSLSDVCGQKITFINTATPGQSLAEAWATADVFASHRAGVIVYGFNYSKLSEGIEDTKRRAAGFRLPFRQPASLTEHLSQTLPQRLVRFPAPRALGWLYANRKGYWRSNLVEDEVRDKIDPFHGQHHRYKAPPMSWSEKHAIAARYFAESMFSIERNNKEAVRILTAFIRDFRKNGSKVVFIVLPESRVMAQTQTHTEAYLQKAIQNLRHAGASVFDFRHHPELREDDFYDQTHLLASGRQKIHHDLINILADHFTDCDQR